MALLIGDFVVIKEGSAAAALNTFLNQIIQATSGNLAHLQTLVTAGLAEALQIGPPKRYVALLTQSGSDAPTATVLRTSLSDTLVWARSSAGIYTATLASEFTANKTTARVAIKALVSGNEFQADIVRTSANVLTLTVRDFGGNAIDAFAAAVVEIEVYS